VEIASELAALSPVALAQAKRAVYDGVELPLAGGLAVESEAFLATMLSDAGVAAMRSYVETPLDERYARAQP
jgi:enoyl-CoA hydratase